MDLAVRVDLGALVVQEDQVAREVLEVITLDVLTVQLVPVGLEALVGLVGLGDQVD